MYRKKDNAEREARSSSRAELLTRSYKASAEKGVGLLRDSEGRIVPFEGLGQHNPALVKGAYFVHATNEPRTRRMFFAFSAE